MHRRARHKPIAGFFRRPRARSQSAMEYLMTYGWAILIIAVVLGVLFQLGIFNGATFAPKAKPGQCQVEILSSGSSTTHALAGLCQPELPQYVAQFSEPSSSPYTYFYASTPPSMQSVTLSLWIDPSSAPAGGATFAQVDTVVFNNGACGGGGGGGGVCLYITPPGTGIDVLVSSLFGFGSSGTVPVTANSWTNLALVYTVSGTTATWTGYVNGVSVGGGSGATSAISAANVVFGSLSYAYTGGMANIQLYNTTLSSTEVYSIYSSGIGGAPVKPQNLVGWWPLNSNLNDYSGNNNNGQVSGSLGYSGSWASSYTGPQ